MLFVNEKYNPIKNILNSINEATMKGGGANDDYTKYDYTYALAVIDKLLNGENIRINAKGDAEFSNSSLTSKHKEALKKLKNDIAGSTAKEFDAAVNGSGLKWTNIFKGDFSGYSKGLETKNKGNAFEAQFIAEFNNYEKQLQSIAGYEKVTGKPEAWGALNQKRPLTFSGGKITCGPNGDFNIGGTVADIMVPVTKCAAAPEGKLYLSLKYGNTVTFVNSGVKTLFTKAFFDGEEELSANAKSLLNMLCIDEGRFREVFTSYKGKKPGEKKSKADKLSISITDTIKRNSIFKTFMKSVMGYGFILVHQNNNKSVDFIDLTTPEALNDFIAEIEDAYVLYPKPGEAKRVDVVIKYPKIEFKINIRSKDGGILPTHIMADYKFTK